MNESSWDTFYELVRRQVEHRVEHFETIRKTSGVEAATAGLETAVNHSNALIDLASGLNGALTFNDMLVYACWDLVALALDLERTDATVALDDEGQIMVSFPNETKWDQPESLLMALEDEFHVTDQEEIQQEDRLSSSDKPEEPSPRQSSYLDGSE